MKKKIIEWEIIIMVDRFLKISKTVKTRSVIQVGVVRYEIEYRHLPLA